MIDFPGDLQFQCLLKLKNPTICRYTDKTDTPPKYRYHLIIPYNGTFLKCSITSKVDHMIDHYHNKMLEGSDGSLVEITIKKRSIINCNDVKLYGSLRALSSNLNNVNEFQICRELTDEEKVLVIKAIKESPYTQGAVLLFISHF